MLAKNMSLVRNLKSLLNTKSGQERDFACMDGLKVISVTWIILGHSFGILGLFVSKYNFSYKTLN